MTKPFLVAYAAKLAVEWGRDVGAAEAEAEVTRVVRKVAASLAASPRYAFGYHGRDDVEQQGVLYALQVIDSGKYDVSRPLENFLHIHVRNRLINHRRDHYLRTEPPCRCCDPFQPPPEPCRRWREWHARNAAKQSLMRPLDVAAVGGEGAAAGGDDGSYRELVAAIDAGLPAHLRADYLRMRAGVPVAKGRRQAVRRAVAEIAAPWLDPEEDD